MPVKNIIPGQTVAKEKLQRAHELRRDMTPAENILWQELRGNKLGVHFSPLRLRHLPKYDDVNFGSAFRLFLVVFGGGRVGAGFIVDFYCHKAGLVVEVDGDIHDLQQEKDERREKVLSEMGLRVVRFRNDEILKELSAVLGKVRELIVK